MLSGRTSVYVDTALSGEDAPKENDPLEASRALLKELENERKKKRGKVIGLDRSQFGKFIIYFDAGKSFGELALMNANALRNATIISDEDSDLLVIHRDLFNSTLKAKQEQEYRERREFIRRSPLFKKWNPRFKKLLEMSLIKETLAFDSYIVRQGQPVEGLHFIVRGRARIVVEPGSHKNQYKSMFEGDSILEKEFGRKSERREHKNRDSMLAEQIRVRRRQGYAAAERRIVEKNMDLCFVDESEVIGDVEIIMDLPTYCQSVVCTSNCEVFLVDNKNIERLITKRNQQTLEMLKPLIEHKLLTRSETRVGSQVELYRRLLNKIEESKPKRMLGKQKEKEGRDLMMSQLAKLYIEDRTPAMVEPYVPGTVYYVTKSITRARRKEARLKAQKRSTSVQQEKKISFNVRLERARKQPRHARSRRELERLTAPPDSKLLNIGENGASRYLSQVGIDPTNVRPNTAIVVPDRTQDFVDSPRSKSAPVVKQEEKTFPLTEVFSDGEEGFTSAQNRPGNDETIRQIVQDMGDAQHSKNKNRSKVICSMVEKQIQQEPPSIQILLRPKSAPAYQYMDSDDELDGEEFDCETGHAALANLEDRLRHFHGKFSEKKASVSELRRFEIKKPEDVPIPGGTVYVKQRSCSYLPDGSGEAAGHSHVRRFMIPRHAMAVASRSLINSYDGSKRPRTAVPMSNGVHSATTTTSGGSKLRGGWR